MGAILPSTPPSIGSRWRNSRRGVYHVRCEATWGVSLVIRNLLVLAALAILAPLGCGQSSSPPEGQEKRAGAERAEPSTASAGGRPWARRSPRPSSGPWAIRG